jgi:hypothetical protein
MNIHETIAAEPVHEPFIAAIVLLALTVQLIADMLTQRKG